MYSHALTLGGALLAALLAGCATAPPATLYTLSATGIAAAAQPGAPAMAVSVGPVSLPDAVDRPQLVVRVADNRVALLEGHRWAEPLKRALAAIVAENLARRLPAARVAVFGEHSAGAAAWRVLLDVRRFDSIPGEATELHVQWSVRAPDGGEARAGRSELREPAPGAGYDALAAAHSRALARLGGEIAAVLAERAGKVR